MIRRSKKYKESEKSVDKKKIYSLEEAVAILKKMSQLKFDQSINLGIQLNIDPKSSDQLLRGTVVLPHGTGKTKRIAVFCKGEAEKQAREAGADFIGGQELIDKVNGGWLDFDVAVSTPEMMKDLSKLGKVLGPRGLMPSPKTGTVTNNIAQAVNELKAGKIEFKTDKQGGIHVVVGRMSFEASKLVENISTLLSAIKANRPASVKGNLIKSVSLATTMSPGVKVTA
ncbi:MAG: 50S ribosomal protein L1 [Candidatus Omnitrophica bacterium]|nr:50S ribosomal protein L1 [Candidatus Omnitrophota bacterium]MDD5352191.1 50S ribosomal protein L1 [Candidatus Omnitrophota bacterium]MDD5549789.1 50S ribosomal protein L1 [Candidatus Omnitrophota bacterium]